MTVLKDVWGDNINLTGERITHILEHPEMRGQEAKLAGTLIKPDIVVNHEPMTPSDFSTVTTEGSALEINIFAWW